ncbi:MAG: HAD-IA family hydrolase [Candidatus Latescibacteria bacterium]|nr:HAD-IA family hydrolase [Candidatus Latescibacterota bacterium]
MPTALPPYLLLDLDDTILAFDASAEPCWQQICVHFAPHLQGPSAAELYQRLTQARDWYWSDPERHRQGRLDLDGTRSRIIANALVELGRPNEELAGEIARAYGTMRIDSLEAFPGAIETLDYFQSQGIGLALVTNGTGGEQRAKIERFDLARFFTSIVIEGEFGVGKPDPSVFLHALDQLGAQPHQAWMVGDNLDWEIEVPQQLGMQAIWVDCEKKGLPPDSAVRPDRTIHSLAELGPR